MGRLDASALNASRVSGDFQTADSASVTAMRRAVTLKQVPAMSAETTQMDSCVRGERPLNVVNTLTKSMLTNYIWVTDLCHKVMHAMQRRVKLSQSVYQI